MKSTSKVLRRILESFAGHRSFCVVGHVRPDGDCIGSQLALALALKGQGKKVVCWNEDPVPRKLAFLDPSGLFQLPRPGGSFECVVATDCASFERLGRAGEFLDRRRLLINIDHHQSNTRYGDVNWVRGVAPSTGELIHELLKAAGWGIDPAIADCLYTAISTDTGSFQYPNTRPHTYRVAGELVKLGADLGRICNELYQSFPLPRIRLLQHVYNSFRLTHDGRTAYFWLRKGDYIRTGAGPDDGEGLIDHIRAIEAVVVACVFEELASDLTRISLRSKSDDVHVNEILAPFGGGGHYAAAGARIRGRPAAVQQRVLRAVKLALNSHV